MNISWEVCKERNTPVIRHHQYSTTMVIGKIKDEALAWCLASAKHLSNVIPEEHPFLMS
jgi:hypothetical protein